MPSNACKLEILRLLSQVDKKKVLKAAPVKENKTLLKGRRYRSRQRGTHLLLSTLCTQFILIRHLLLVVTLYTYLGTYIWNG
jgi:hypothetical protein